MTNPTSTTVSPFFSFPSLHPHRPTFDEALKHLQAMARPDQPVSLPAGQQVSLNRSTAVGRTLKLQNTHLRLVWLAPNQAMTAKADDHPTGPPAVIANRPA